MKIGRETFTGYLIARGLDPSRFADEIEATYDSGLFPERGEIFTWEVKLLDVKRVNDRNICLWSYTRRNAAGCQVGNWLVNHLKDGVWQPLLEGNFRHDVTFEEIAQRFPSFLASVSG